MGNTPPSSLPLGLPPPSIDILGGVAVNVSLDHSLTPRALASFLKDTAVSLLFGATVQTYFSPIYTSAALPWLMVLLGLLVLLVVLPHFGSLNPSSSLKTNQRRKYGKRKRGRGLHSKILASLFFLGCIATALDTDDGSEIGMQVCLYSFAHKTLESHTRRQLTLLSIAPPLSTIRIKTRQIHHRKLSA